MWNLLLDVKDLQDNPSVSLRLPAPFSREPIAKGSLILYIAPKTDIFLPNVVYASPCKKVVGFHGDFL
ncbi:hypothetical protein [Ruminococcus callidus]|uniref:hypothetical protein n=1 Tax=Ruminococcus callidus TaxID=40519 RepID=UPI0023F41E61|nr:hypothetical protein [Ruminococcus callidus]